MPYREVVKEKPFGIPKGSSLIRCPNIRLFGLKQFCFVGYYRILKWFILLYVGNHFVNIYKIIVISQPVLLFHNGNGHMVRERERVWSASVLCTKARPICRCLRNIHSPEPPPKPYCRTSPKLYRRRFPPPKGYRLQAAYPRILQILPFPHKHISQSAQRDCRTERTVENSWNFYDWLQAFFTAEKL